MQQQHAQQQQPGLPASRLPSRRIHPCPHCGGCLFLEIDNQGGRPFYYWDCANCAREYSVVGRLLAGSVAPGLLLREPQMVVWRGVVP